MDFDNVYALPETTAQPPSVSNVRTHDTVRDRPGRDQSSIQSCRPRYQLSVILTLLGRVGLKSNRYNCDYNQ